MNYLIKILKNDFVPESFFAESVFKTFDSKDISCFICHNQKQHLCEECILQSKKNFDILVIKKIANHLLTQKRNSKAEEVAKQVQIFNENNYLYYEQLKIKEKIIHLQDNLKLIRERKKILFEQIALIKEEEEKYLKEMVENPITQKKIKNLRQTIRQIHSTILSNFKLLNQYRENLILSLEAIHGCSETKKDKNLFLFLGVLFLKTNETKKYENFIKFTIKKDRSEELIPMFFFIYFVSRCASLFNIDLPYPMISKPNFNGFEILDLNLNSPKDIVLVFPSKLTNDINETFKQVYELFSNNVNVLCKSINQDHKDDVWPEVLIRTFIKIPKIKESVKNVSSKPSLYLNRFPSKKKIEVE